MLGVVVTYFSYLALDLYQSKQDYLIAEIVRTQSAALERRLERSLSSTRILAQEVRQHGGLFPDFEAFSEEIIQTIGGISNLQLAPNGVIHSIYPLAGNEKAIGHNILKDDERRKEALLALDERYMTLAGPFELIQGGIAVIGRNPIFLKDDATGKESFWGFASALVYLDDLLQVTDLKNYEEAGYAFELFREHPDTGELVTIASSAKEVNRNEIQTTIEVPNSEWYLRMSEPTPLTSAAYWSALLISIALSAVITLLIRKILQQPSVLRSVVDSQTKELRHLAHHDPLTDLPNRAKLKDAVERSINQNRRYGTPTSLLMIDLDDFKPINDLFGHEIGDYVLQVISERVLACTREVDTVARMGGDEFAVLLEHAGSVSEITRCVTSILEEIRKPIELTDQSHSLSASIGIVTIPDDGDDFTSLYRHADLAMYAAKSAGKNSFVFYDKSLQEEAVNRINTQKELERALKNNELLLYLQPIVSISDEKTVSYELLMRWNHPEKGLIPPGQFIPIAEESNIIFDLSYWAIEECCRLIRDNNIRVPLSVNLSPKQFKHPDLVSRVRECMSKYKIPASQIEIELTESCFIESFDYAISTMNHLLELGISISLDDFGTGFSSLTLLQRLPVSKLKIDRSFINDIHCDKRDEQIVQALIWMARNLDLQVVAEGIELPEQLSLLRGMNCDLGQGYYFSKPLPVSHFF